MERSSSSYSGSEEVQMTGGIKEQAAQALMQLLLKWYYPEQSTAKVRSDYLQRGLICTPFAGGYGKVSGWVICVNGSPPKGTLVVFGKGPPNAPAYYLSGRSRRIS